MTTVNESDDGSMPTNLLSPPFPSLLTNPPPLPPLPTNLLPPSRHPLPKRDNPARFLVSKFPNTLLQSNGDFYPNANSRPQVISLPTPVKKNRTMAPYLTGVCSCGPCGNNVLFPDGMMQAYSAEVSSSSENPADIGVYNMILPYNETFDFKLPSNSRIAGHIIFTVIFPSKKGVPVTHKYTTLGRLLKFLKSFEGSVRTLSVTLEYKYFDEEDGLTWKDTVKIRVKPDHCNKLVMCFFNDSSTARIFIQMADVETAYNAISTNAAPVNTSYLYRFLGGPKKVYGKPPGFPVSKRTQFPPCVQPLIDYNGLSPVITREVSQNLVVVGIFERGVHDIVLGYISAGVQVTGPLTESPLKDFFNSPLYDPALLNLIAVFMHCPRKLSALGDAYTNSKKYPTLEEQRKMYDDESKEL
jgi:hypothetical protein